MTHSEKIRRKRLLFRSWHRGTRESDLILGRFAAIHLARFDAVQLDRYEALLDCADAELFDWVAGHAAPPAPCDHDVMRLLVAFVRSGFVADPGPATEGPEEDAGGESA